MTKAREVWLSCYGHWCRNSIKGIVKKGAKMSDASAELEGRAGKLGWVMGLDSSGQAHYGCPSCGPSLYNTFTLDDYRSRFRRVCRPAIEEIVSNDT